MINVLRRYAMYTMMLGDFGRCSRHPSGHALRDLHRLEELHGLQVLQALQGRRFVRRVRAVMP